MERRRAAHVYLVHTNGLGRITGSAWSNASVDHGVPSDSAEWDVNYKDKAAMLRATGGTHFGVSGCVVRVELDGQLIDRNAEPLKGNAAQMYSLTGTAEEAAEV